MIATASPKKKAVHAAIAKIKKKYGDRAIVRAEEVAPVERYSSGSFGIDLLTYGGFAFDRIVEVHGGSSSGKTALSLRAINSYLRSVPDGVTMFFDAEAEFDKEYAISFIDRDLRDRLYYRKTCSAETITKIVLDALDEREPVQVVIDSIANVRGEDEFEKDQENPGGSRARGAHSRAIGALTFGIVNKLGMLDPRECGKMSFIYLNQARINPNTLFSDPEETTGGKAKEHSVTQKIHLRRLSPIRKTKEKSSPILGFEVKATLRKTRVKGRDLESATLNYYTRECGGIEAHSFDDAADLLPHALDLGIVRLSGKKIVYGSMVSANREKFLASLRRDPELLRSVFQKTLEKRIEKYDGGRGMTKTAKTNKFKITRRGS